MLSPEFLIPVSDDIVAEAISHKGNKIGKATFFHSSSGFPELPSSGIALLNVSDYRLSSHAAEARDIAADFRKRLYALHRHEHTINLVDLGTLRVGNSPEDTRFALAEICRDLMVGGLIPVLIGGSQDLTLAMHEAYRPFGRLINMAGIDARFDLGSPENPVADDSWLGKIILQQPTFLFNFSNIGYQTHFVGSEQVEFMNRLLFDAYRVGEARTNLSEMEPVIRSSDLISFDISSIKQSDAPGNTNPSPNGLSGEDACQLMLYAGLNDQLSSIGFFEFDGNHDVNGQTSHLAAQMIWYLMEGVSNRMGDFPGQAPESNFTKYHVEAGVASGNLVFLKHNFTSRWWLELPKPVSDDNPDLKRKRFIPCSPKDYQQAMQNEMPERLWRIIQKL
ncbi:MAG: formimidoylglutamase [Bacteroidota bacterium]|jgi:formiminoglutamase